PGDRSSLKSGLSLLGASQHISGHWLGSCCALYASTCLFQHEQHIGRCPPQTHDVEHHPFAFGPPPNVTPQKKHVSWLSSTADSQPIESFRSVSLDDSTHETSHSMRLKISAWLSPAATAFASASADSTIAQTFPKASGVTCASILDASMCCARISPIIRCSS